MDTLNEVSAAGYIIDEWSTWQQGLCDTYAMALLSVNPSMRMGVLGESYDDGWMEQHFFAHDDTHAYDSAGRHTLPYHGIHGGMDITLLDQDPVDYGVDDALDHPSTADAFAHIERHNIFTRSAVDSPPPVL